MKSKTTVFAKDLEQWEEIQGKHETLGLLANELITTYEEMQKEPFKAITDVYGVGFIRGRKSTVFTPYSPNFDVYDDIDELIDDFNFKFNREYEDPDKEDPSFKACELVGILRRKNRLSLLNSLYTNELAGVIEDAYKIGFMKALRCR